MIKKEEKKSKYDKSEKKAGKKKQKGFFKTFSKDTNKFLPTLIIWFTRILVVF